MSRPISDPNFVEVEAIVRVLLTTMEVLWRKVHHRTLPYKNATGTATNAFFTSRHVLHPFILQFTSTISGVNKRKKKTDNRSPCPDDSSSCVLLSDRSEERPLAEIVANIISSAKTSSSSSPSAMGIEKMVQSSSAETESGRACGDLRLNVVPSSASKRFHFIGVAFRRVTDIKVMRFRNCELRSWCEKRGTVSKK